MLEKKLRRYIIPNVLAMLGISLYILADTFFISVAAGANGITALNLSLPIYGFMFAIGSMIGIGSSIKYNITKSIGLKEHKDYFSNSIICTLLVSIPFVLLGIFAPDTVLKLMGADETILKTGHTYIKTILMFAPVFMVNYTFTSFVRNDGEPNIAMAATLSSTIFNIVFDYVFMFPMKMGMFGAALATGLSPILSICVCMIHYLSDKNSVVFIKKLPSFKKLIQSCSLGISGFVGELSNGLTSMVFNFILLDLIGNIAVAAYGVVANISLVGIAIFNGVSQGLQPMASESAGKGDENSKIRIKNYSIKIGLFISLVIVILLYIFTKQIVAVFNSENSLEMAKYAEIGLRLYSLGFIMASVNIIKSGYFAAIGEAKECSFISVSRGIVAIVILAFVLSRFLGIYGVWIAFPASELITFIISKFLFDRKNLQKKTLA